MILNLALRLRRQPHGLSRLRLALSVKKILGSGLYTTPAGHAHAEIAHADENQGGHIPSLNQEQLEVVNIILSGRNAFYTGAAGTGKSTVLRAVVQKLGLLNKCVCVAAPTGRAALAVQGVTTWSFAGWSPSAHGHPISELRRWARARKKLALTDVLIIDEISMVESHHLERLNHVMKEAKANAAED